MLKKEQIVEIIVGQQTEFPINTKKEAKEYAEAKIQEINELVEKIGETLEVGDKARLGNLEIAKVEVGAKSGEITLADGTKKAWTKDAEVIVKVKLVR